MVSIQIFIEGPPPLRSGSGLPKDPKLLPSRLNNFSHVCFPFQYEISNLKGRQTEIRLQRKKFHGR